MSFMESAVSFMAVSFLSTENIKSLCLGMFVSLSGYFVIQYKRTYSFWSSRGVHGPTPLPFFGNFHLYMFGSIPHVDYELGRRYGRMYGVYEGRIPVLMVSDPEIIEKIFISDHSSFKLQIGSPSTDPLIANQIFFLEGEEVKRVRGVIASALTGSKLKQFFEQVKFDDLNDFLEKNSGKEVNVSSMFTLHMLNVVSQHFYGLDLDLFNNPDHELVTAALGFGFTATRVFIMRNAPFLADRMMRRVKRTNGLLEFICKLCSRGTFEAVHAFEWSHEERKGREGRGKKKKRKRKKKEEKGRKKDLLQTMTDANFTDIQLKANSIAMTKAGFGTTQTTLCFLCFEMARMERSRERCRKKLTKFCG